MTALGLTGPLMKLIIGNKSCITVMNLLEVSAGIFSGAAV